MVALEDAGRPQSERTHDVKAGCRRLLVMSVAHPRKRTRDGDGDGEVGDHAHDEHRVVVVLVVDKDCHDLEQEPGEPRQRASGVNATKMLEDRCAA